jgi:hypothetical protein
MTQRAFIYLVALPLATETYIGKKDVDAALMIQGTASYGSEGRRENMRILRIEPPESTPNSETIPAVYVIPLGATWTVKDTKRKGLGPRTRPV